MSEAGGAMAANGGGLSRRTVLGGVAAGAALSAAGSVVLPEMAGAAATLVSVAPKGTTAIEFMVRIEQHGPNLNAYGFLTNVYPFSPDELFFSEPENEASAVFTAVAEGTVESAVVRNAVHSLDVHGELSIYQRDDSGASFTDPSSFAVGTLVAHYSLVIQDILTVIDTGRGIPTLIGDLKQDQASSLGSGQGRFGRVGLQLRMTATGLGNRSNTDPAPPEAVLDVAGNLAVV